MPVPSHKVASESASAVKPDHDSRVLFPEKKGVLRCLFNKFRVGLHEVEFNIEFFWVNVWLHYCIRRVPGNLSMENTCLIDMYLACQKFRVD